MSKEKRNVSLKELFKMVVEKKYLLVIVDNPFIQSISLKEIKEIKEIKESIYVSLDEDVRSHFSIISFPTLLVFHNSLISKTYTGENEILNALMRLKL